MILARTVIRLLSPGHRELERHSNHIIQSIPLAREAGNTGTRFLHLLLYIAGSRLYKYTAGKPSGFALLLALYGDVIIGWDRTAEGALIKNRVYFIFLGPRTVVWWLNTSQMYQEQDDGSHIESVM